MFSPLLFVYRRCKHMGRRRKDYHEIIYRYDIVSETQYDRELCCNFHFYGIVLYEDGAETGRMERISSDIDFVNEIIEMMKKLKIGGEKFYIFAAKYIVRHSDMYAWQ